MFSTFGANLTAMDREIKFRYHYLTEGAGADAAFGREIDGILFENGDVSEVLIDGDPWPVANDKNGECGALCQYTGLKDRNGVEIYEGDVLADGSEVKWSVSGWWAVPVNLNRHPDRLFPLNIEAEVIGNIHENPELLKS